MTLILPKDYHPTLTVRDTEAALVFIRETFQDKLAEILGLQRMSAPMFVEKKTGLNDNLNGVERPVALIALKMFITVTSSVSVLRSCLLIIFSQSHWST